MSNALIVLLVVLVAFLIGRELVCWYFKINVLVSELRGIREALQDKSTGPAEEPERQPGLLRGVIEAGKRP